MNYPPIQIILDFETTGLEPDKNRPLELAAIAVRMSDLTEVEYFNMLIGPLPAPGEMGPGVWAMHYRSGLLGDMVTASESNNLVPAHYVKNYFIDWLKRVRVPHEGRDTPLIGFSPAFDRSFLEEHMSEVVRYFDYRNLNMTSFHMLQSELYPNAPERPAAAHRALADCRSVLESMRYFGPMISP